MKRLGGKDKVDSEIDVLLSDGVHWPAFLDRIAPILWPGGTTEDNVVSEQKHLLNVYYNNRRNIFAKAQKKAETKAILQAERDARNAEKEAHRLQTTTNTTEGEMPHTLDAGAAAGAGAAAAPAVVHGQRSLVDVLMNPGTRSLAQVEKVTPTAAMIRCAGKQHAVNLARLLKRHEARLKDVKASKAKAQMPYFEEIGPHAYSVAVHDFIGTKAFFPRPLPCWRARGVSLRRTFDWNGEICYSKRLHLSENCHGELDLFPCWCQVRVQSATYQ